MAQLVDVMMMEKIRDICWGPDWEENLGMEVLAEIYLKRKEKNYDHQDKTLCMSLGGDTFLAEPHWLNFQIWQLRVSCCKYQRYWLKLDQDGCGGNGHDSMDIEDVWENDWDPQEYGRLNLNPYLLGCPELDSRGGYLSSSTHTGWWMSFSFRGAQHRGYALYSGILVLPKGLYWILGIKCGLAACKASLLTHCTMTQAPWQLYLSWVKELPLPTIEVENKTQDSEVKFPDASIQSHADPWDSMYQVQRTIPFS